MHLLACPACHRQYDVSHLVPGDHVRCACEEYLTVQNPRMLNVHALRCAHCGAAVSAADETCGHCTARLSAASRLATTLCPECFTRLEVNARLCSQCGVDIQPSRLSALPHGSDCPRCHGELANRFLGQYDVIECQACQGVWVVPDTFERLCDRARANRGAPALQRAREVGASSIAQGTGVDVIRYVPCVQCGELMNRRQFRWGDRTAGVVIDACKDHGLWLDGGELRRILEFVKRAGQGSGPGSASLAGSASSAGSMPTTGSGSTPTVTGSEPSRWSSAGGELLVAALEVLGDAFLGDLF